MPWRSVAVAHPRNTVTSTTTPAENDRQRASELRNARPGEGGRAVEAALSALL